MRSLKRFKSVLLASCGAMALSMGGPTLAQDNDPSVNPDNVQKLPTERPIIQYALAGVFLLGAIAIGLKPAPRSTDQKKVKGAA